jgi:hypothetical protein
MFDRDKVVEYIECVIAIMIIMFLAWFAMYMPGPYYMDSGYHADDMPDCMKD